MWSCDNIMLKQFPKILFLKYRFSKYGPLGNQHDLKICLKPETLRPTPDLQMDPRNLHFSEPSW